MQHKLPLDVTNLIAPTRQQIFDWIFYKVYPQGKSMQGSCSPIKYCAYHTDDDKRCAVGQLFNHKERMWGDNYKGTVDGLVTELGHKLRPFYLAEVKFLSDLQRCHDNMNSRRDFSQRMLMLAAHWDLDPSIIYNTTELPDERYAGSGQVIMTPFDKGSPDSENL